MSCIVQTLCEYLEREKHSKRNKSWPLSAHQRNATQMTFRSWADSGPRRYASYYMYLKLVKVDYHLAKEYILKLNKIVLLSDYKCIWPKAYYNHIPKPIIGLGEFI